MSVMKQMASVAAIAFTIASTSASADPIPGQNPPKEGGYQTDWGPATFEYESGNRLYGGINGQFRFADGHIIWGYFERVSDSGPHAWTFVGRWVAKPGNSGVLPRPINPVAKCRGPITNLPYTITPPDSMYWGSIRLSFGSSGTHFSGNIQYCRNEAPPNGPYSEPEISGSFRPVTYSAAPGSNTVPVPSLPYDGPCGAVSRTAVAAIENCRLPIFVPVRMRLLRDMPKAVDRVIFTPLSDDRDAIARALRNNTALPLHPSEREAYQHVRGLKFWKSGDMTDVIPPGSVCRHDFWLVSVRDGTGAVHGNNGVVFMECGPGDLPPDVGGAEQVRGELRPAE